jgi:hypothetical protein
MLSSEVSARLDALQPDAAGELRTIDRMSLEVTDPALLALCTGYMEAAMRCRDWHPPKQGLTEREQAFIDFTEQFVTSVSTLEEGAVTRLLDFATADEIYAFVHAMYVTDMTLRLQIVGQEVLL